MNTNEDSQHIIKHRRWHADFLRVLANQVESGTVRIVDFRTDISLIEYPDFRDKSMRVCEGNLSSLKISYLTNENVD